MNAAFIKSRCGYKTSLNASDIPEAHKAFFERQQLFHIDPKNRCFVHGGFNRHLSFEAQETSAYYWDRSLWEEAITHFRMNGNAGETFFNASNFEEIFIGHTTTTKLASTVPLRIANIINVDTGAGHSGRLTIMDVDTKAYWQSDPTSDLYPENFR
ncbi:hypothetical protein [Mucilaginibacter sp. 22184]|uniref:hypothetical protein n=1 Tax=Mucilaginibacter sp. 22184 TaxID=3453887 RepID=UPI003F833A94